MVIKRFVNEEELEGEFHRLVVENQGIERIIHKIILKNLEKKVEEEVV